MAAKRPRSPRPDRPAGPPQQAVDLNGSYMVESLLAQLRELHFQLAAAQATIRSQQDTIEGLQELAANKVIDGEEEP